MVHCCMLCSNVPLIVQTSFLMQTFKLVNNCSVYKYRCTQHIAVLMCVQIANIYMHCICSCYTDRHLGHECIHIESTITKYAFVVLPLATCPMFHYLPPVNAFRIISYIYNICNIISHIRMPTPHKYMIYIYKYNKCTTDRYYE